MAWIKTSMIIFSLLIASILIVLAVGYALYTVHVVAGVKAAIAAFILVVGLLSVGLGYIITKGSER